MEIHQKFITCICIAVGV